MESVCTTLARCRSVFLINLHLWCYSGKVDEKATQLHAIASLKVLLDATRPHNGAATSTAAHYSGAASKETTLQLQQGSQGTTTTTTTTTTAGTTAGIQELPNGGIAAGLDAGLDSVIVKFDECLIPPSPRRWSQLLLVASVAGASGYHSSALPRNSLLLDASPLDPRVPLA